MTERILLADDEKHIRESMIRLLQRKGYDVDGASSGKEALEKLNEESYDLLLLDIKMPGMSGLDLLRHVKEVNPEIMALIMTGYGTIDNAIEALELGALGFVRKPIPIDELAYVIEDTLARGRLRKENARLRAIMPLFELSKILLSEMDENKLLDLLLDTVISEIKADTIQIMLWDDAGKLIRRAGRGLSKQEHIGKAIIDDMATRAISTFEPVMTSSGNGSGPSHKKNTGPENSNVYVPLVVRGEAIGVLKVTRYGTEMPFQQSDVEFLFTLCGQGSIAIANARLFRSVQMKQAEVEKLLKRLIDTTENERLRLSLELHDGPVQSIVASQYEVEACRMLINQNRPEKALDKLQNAKQTLTQSTQDLRRIVHDLHPPALGSAGFVAAIKDYMGKLEKDDKLSCYLEIKGKPARLDDSTERSIYYMIREALTNVRKHAEASEVRVFVEYKTVNLKLTISDDGKGFNVTANHEETSSHLGIRSMKERARMLNGEINIKSIPGEGTNIKLTVPINQDINKQPETSSISEEAEVRRLKIDEADKTISGG